MKIFHYGKDGGPKSTVWGFWLLEAKRLFSVALLCFEDGSRDSFHSHAFNSISWVLKGKLVEQNLFEHSVSYDPSFKPIITKRSTFHRVVSKGTTWVFTLRGPWADTWQEYDPFNWTFSTLTHGRKEVL